MCESGKFYGALIDPILKRMRLHVALEVQPNKRVIDIACGTGAQALEIAKTASKVCGIDYSDSMIQFAKKATQDQKLANVEFQIGDASKLTEVKNNSFDFAIMTLALHQFDPKLHTPIIKEMKRVANKIIIVDYAVPLPNNYVGYGSKFAEFLAGKGHNQNFKRFCKLGGLNKILSSNGLQIEKSRFIAKGAFQLVVCSHN